MDGCRLGSLFQERNGHYFDFNGVVFFITSIIREWLFYSDNPMSFMDYMVLAVFSLGVSVAVLLILLFGRRVK